MDKKEFLSFGNGKKITYSDLKSLKSEDLGSNEALRKIFNIFDSDGNGVIDVENSKGVRELDSLWNQIKSFAMSNNNSIFESEEAQMLLDQNQSLKDIKSEKLFEFLNIFIQKNDQAKTLQTPKITLSDAQAKDETIKVLEKDLAESYQLFNKQDKGWVTKTYDDLKNYFDSELSSSNVEETLALNAESLEFLKKAGNNQLSKAEFYLENLDHLKKMLKRRIFQSENFDKFIPKNLSKDSLSPEEFINNYIDHMLNGMELEEIKKNQHKLCQMNTSQTEQFVTGILNKAFGDLKSSEEPCLMNTPVMDLNIPQAYRSTEAISYEDVYKIERGVEYSKERVERVLESEYKLNSLSIIFNKFQTLSATIDDLEDNGLNPDGDINNQAKQVIEFLKMSYTHPFDTGFTKTKLEEFIRENKLNLKLVENQNGELEFDMSSSPNPVEELTTLLEVAREDQQKNLENFVGGNLEDKLREGSQTLEATYKLAYGEDFTKSLVQAMENDNVTMISRYTGETSSKGMWISSIGGILCLTPAAPLGGIMVALGNTMALGGMAVNLGLSTAEFTTQEERTADEIKAYRDNMITTIGGFAAGMVAGKIGDKAFKNMIDPKSLEVVKELFKKGKRIDAIKALLLDKNIAPAFISKVGSDFGISLSADLVMMGALDTNESLEDLIKANLMGIVVGTTSDVAGVSKGVNRGVGVNSEINKGSTNTEVEIPVESGSKNAGESVSNRDSHNAKPKSPNELSVRKENSEGTPLEMKDYEEINVLMEVISDAFSRENLVSKIKYKEQIPVLKELLKLKVVDLWKESEISLPPHSLGDILEKINNLDELKEVTDAISKNPQYWNTVVNFYKTPYFNLVSKALSRLDHYKSWSLIDEIKLLLEGLETSQSIAAAEKYLDNLDESQKFANPTRLKAAIHGDNNITDAVRPLRAIIDNKFGEGRSLFFSEEELYEISQQISTPAQKKILFRLIELNYNKAWIAAFLKNVSGEEDVRFIELIINKVSYENKDKSPQDRSLQINRHLGWDFGNLKPEQKTYVRTLYKLYSQNKLADFEFNKLRMLKLPDGNKNLADYIEQKLTNMDYANLQNFLSNDIVNKILDYGENEFALEAMKLADEYNKTKDHFDSPIDLFSYGEEAILANIKNKNDLDFYKQLLEKGVDIGESLNYLMKASTDTNKRQVILALVEYTNKYGRDEYGSKNFDNETLENIVKMLDSEENITKLMKLLKGNLLGKKYRLEEIEVILSKSVKNKDYIKILQAKYPYLQKYQKEISQIKNDTEFDIFMKIYKDGETNPLDLIQLIQKARECEYGYNNLMHIANNLEISEKLGFHKGHNLNALFTLISKPDGIEKINKLIDSDLYKNLSRDTLISEGNSFYNEAYVQDLIKAKNGNYIQRFDSSMPTKDIINKVSNGDVITIDGVLHIRDGNELVKLGLSEETYLKLFPPGERFLTQQGEVGDCWLVSTLDILLKNPKGRVELLKLFKEDGGKLFITLPNQEPMLCNGVNDKGASELVQGCEGFAYLERAVAKARANNSNIDINVATDIEKIKEILDGGLPEDAFKLLFGDLGKNLPVIRNKAVFENILEKYANSEMAVLKAGINFGVVITNEIKHKYGLDSRHAYNIEGYDKENKIVYVINPHNTKYRLEIPLDVYKKYFSNIYIYDFDKV